jgi:hypothetical protein
MVARSEILKQIIEPGKGDLSPELARYVLSLGFTNQLQERYRKLSDRAQSGKLTPLEESELDEYLSTDAFISILKSKARVSLKSHPGSRK